MHFTGLLQEQLWLTSHKEEARYVLTQSIKTGLTIFWSQAEDTSFFIDGRQYILKNNELIFLTEFHKLEVGKINHSRVLRFNRPFYCINHNNEDDCNGILFFGASQVPIVNLPEQQIEKFDTIWKQLNDEMQLIDDLQMDMIRHIIKQLVISCTRLYKNQMQIMDMEKCRLDIVREFNFLVEMHYKTKHSVMEYAGMLNKAPKTLSNLFLQYNQTAPLQIIQERILLEAQRLLLYSDRTIKDITYELGFEDIQTFSRFFKNKKGVSPTDFRQKIKTNSTQVKLLTYRESMPNR